MLHQVSYKKEMCIFFFNVSGSKRGPRELGGFGRNKNVEIDLV